MTIHVFAETNWIVGVAAPAHHKQPAAIHLLERARRGEVTLHVPAMCFTEARRPILEKAPRKEADAIREFVAWARSENRIVAADVEVVHRVLNQFEGQIKKELASLDEILAELRAEPSLDVYPFDEACSTLARTDGVLRLDLKPFDQAILASVLARSKQLGETEGQALCFCEADSDLQPWDKDGNLKRELTALYDSHGIWVYGDFLLQTPARPASWPLTTQPQEP